MLAQLVQVIGSSLPSSLQLSVADKVLQIGLPVGVLAGSLENWPLDVARSSKFALAPPSRLLMIPGISSGSFATAVSYGFMVLPMCCLWLPGVSWGCLLVCCGYLVFPMTSWRSLWFPGGSYA